MSSAAWFFLAGLVIGAALGLFVAAWCMAVGDAGERTEQLKRLRRRMDNRGTGQFWSDECMICGEPALDADEIEAANTPPNFNPVDSLWVYCRPCDCWTEHPATPLREAKNG